MVKGSQNGKSPYTTAYSYEDQPIGTAIPYTPQARTTEAGGAPSLGFRSPSESIKPYPVSEKHSQKKSDAPALDKKAVPLPTLPRPTISVTDIPGAAATPFRIGHSVSMSSSSILKPIKAPHNEGEANVIIVERKAKRDAYLHSTFPAFVTFAVGLIFPPVLLLGYRFIRSVNYRAKVLGVASLFTFLLYCTAGIIIFAKFWRSDSWDGSDPSCIRYSMGSSSNYLSSELGSPISIQGVDPGTKTLQNISLYTVNCMFMGQLMVTETTTDKNAPKVLVVRMVSPGTQGDDFGVYARKIDAKISQAAIGAKAPSRAWLEYASPFLSNPWPQGSAYYGTAERPPCSEGMCDGVYGQSLPALAGSQYEVRVNFLWYRYYVIIGVVAKTKQALERPFCVDTCVLEYVESPVGSGKYVDPCEGIELSICPNINCVFAKTRAQCLGG
mmetsp:Transcript_36892/g.83181  ORF Transcript_36892/g.83181 Transcript_36892/m.83181 type:complete len:441 (-) Transcript_36892:96-1418(-)